MIRLLLESALNLERSINLTIYERWGKMNITKKNKLD